MKAAPLKERPPFALMKQTDIQNAFHLQMPRWLFTDPLYKSLSLEAKVVYTFLLNRFQLSKLNGWTNESGEVFIIYTRASLAEEIQISYRKAIEAMKELTGRKLVWEKRCGRGDANQIYLARVDHTEERGGSAPFVSPGSEAAGALSPEDGPRSAEDAPLEVGGDGIEPDAAAARDASSALQRPQEVPDRHSLTCAAGTSAGAKPAGLEVPGAHSSKNDKKKTDGSYPDVSLSGHDAAQQQESDLLELDLILAQCDLQVFDPETAKVFENAIERLFFTENYHIGRACLPQAKVRSHLHELDAVKLQAAEQKLRQNTREVKNSTAYTMAVIFNTIWECESDLLVDPYLNELRCWPVSPGGAAPGEGVGGCT